MSPKTTLTNVTFAAFVQTQKIGIVHFWARWNAHDFLMRDILASQVPADLRAQIAFAEFDVDSEGHEEVSDLQRVVNVPFLACYRDGEFVDGMTGMHSPEVIVRWLTKLIA